MPDPSYLNGVLLFAGVDQYKHAYGNGQINYGTVIILIQITD